MEPTRRYILASTPRSGSNLLCEGLTATGIAGKPVEPYCPHFQPELCRRWGLSPDASFADHLGAVVREGTTDNGVFGTKVHWHQLDYIARAAGPAGDGRHVLERLFPGAVYIHLTRRDRRAQAISLFRARATNEWWRIHGVESPLSRKPEPAFDAKGIRYVETLLEGYERFWDLYFSEMGLSPLTLSYEALALDYRGEVARVLAFLGLDRARALEIPEPRHERQADETTELWRQRLDAEDREGERDRKGARAQGKTKISASLRPCALAVSGPSLPGPGAEALAHPTWVRREGPFPHVTARSVFTPAYYASLEDQLREILGRGLSDSPRQERFCRDPSAQGVYALNLGRGATGPLSLFVSPGWHDLCAGLFGVAGDRQITVGLRHHPIGSPDGPIRSDFNPAWFPVEGTEGVSCPQHNLCAYRTGAGPLSASKKARVVRAVGMIFYLCNDGWAPGDGGETGLFEPGGAPAARIQPENNSILLFECAPSSLHAFLHNPGRAVNAVVLWTHRSTEDALARWPGGALEEWMENRET